MHFGEVANTARNCYVTLIFDRPGPGAITDPGIPVLRIGEKWNKKDVHSFVSKDPAQFGEFGVITNEYSDLAAIRIKGL